MSFKFYVALETKIITLCDTQENDIKSGKNKRDLIEMAESKEL